MIKHIWFDFSDTLARVDDDVHDNLRYRSYAEAIGKPYSTDIRNEYLERLKQFGSNTGVFRLLGLPANYWSLRMNSVPPNKLYKLADPVIPEVLKKLKNIVPISYFSNIDPTKILPALGVDNNNFTYIIKAGMVREPKPALEGFKKIVEMTHIPVNQILFIGDSLIKDIRPAKQVGLQTGLIWSASPEADYSFNKFEDILDLFRK